MKKKISKSLLMTTLITGLCFGGVQGAFASEELNTFALDEYVVTATRTMEQAIKIPAMVSVVTEQQIKEKNVNTITDALKMLPGVYDARPGGMSDTANGIQIRGYGEEDILVLYDGMPLNDGYSTDVNWSVVSVDDVAKIEVVKGAASSLYGGKAVGAVINIISKDPDKDSVRAYFNYGSDSTWKRGVNLNKKINEKLSVGFGYENKETDGHPKKLVQTQKGNSDTPSGTIGTGVVTDIRNNGKTIYILGLPGTGASEDNTYNFKIKYKFDDNKSLNYRYTHDDYKYFAVDPVSYIHDANGNKLFEGSVLLPDGKYYNFDEGDFTDYDGRRKVDRHAIQYRDEDNKIDFNIGVTNVKDFGYSTGSDFAGEGSGNDSKYPNKSYKADFQKVWESDNNTVVAGFNLQKDSMDYIKSSLAHWGDKNSVTSVKSTMGGTNIIGALFIQDQYKFNDKFGVTAGLRLDHYQKKDGYYRDKSSSINQEDEKYTELSPKVAFEYTPNENTTYYISYGHSFNPPTLYKLYRHDPSYGYVANPDLEPEITDTFEVGLKKQFDKKTYMGIALYSAKTTDMINAETRDDGKKWYVNIDEAKRLGAEFELRHDFNNNLGGYINYSIQNVEDGNGERIYSFPKNLLHAGLKYKKDKLSAYIDGQYVSSCNEPGWISNKLYSEDGFFIANIGINYKIMKNATLTFAVDNLFDKEYWQWYKAAGRTVMTGVQFEF